jgi:ribosomal protein S18 acetylase RimI-like enzyme
MQIHGPIGPMRSLRLRHSHRHRNHGLAACLSLARNAGIEKVELDVFSDNVGALRLYDSFGFSEEGRKVRGRKLDDRYQNALPVGLWL